MNDFKTASGGRRFASHVGGALTGRGADIIIIDDPHKADDALTDANRQAVHSWFDRVLLSRLDNRSNGAIIIVMQRLHEDDLVAHVLKHGNWDVLALPVFAETEERHLIEGPLGRRFFIRKRGELLDPLREDATSLKAIICSLPEDFCVPVYAKSGVACVETREGSRV